MNYHLAAKTTGICSLIAGLLHATIIAYQHWTPFPPLETGLFVVIGIWQLLLGYQFWTKPSIRTYRTSLFVNGGIATLYVLVRFLPVPFVGEPEGLELLGVIITALELIAVATSVRWLLLHAEHGKDRTLPVTASCALVAIIVGGLSYYGGAQGMAMLMPHRTVAHHHGHHDSHVDESDHHEEHDAKSAPQHNDHHAEEVKAGHHKDHDGGHGHE